MRVRRIPWHRFPAVTGVSAVFVGALLMTACSGGAPADGNRAVPSGSEQPAEQATQPAAAHPEEQAAEQPAEPAAAQPEKEEATEQATTGLVAPTPRSTAGHVPRIAIVNFSRFATEEIRRWTEVGTAKMSWWQTDIHSFVWPLGKMLGEADFPGDDPFNTYEVVLTTEAMNQLTGAYGA